VTKIPPTVLLGNLLASYFGDQDDETAIPKLRKDAAGASSLGRELRAGLAAALSDPEFDCAGLVRECTNRRADTQAQGRAWLLRLQTEIFGATRVAAVKPHRKRSA
jgi:hypothetical protein